jgi:integrase
MARNPRQTPRGRRLSKSEREEILGYGPDGVRKMSSSQTAPTVWRCIYTPHSLRATTATLLLDANVDIIKVKDLLGHRHVTTTQIYDKRRRSTSESASHLLAI